MMPKKSEFESNRRMRGDNEREIHGLCELYCYNALRSLRKRRNSGKNRRKEMKNAKALNIHA